MKGSHGPPGAFMYGLRAPNERHHGVGPYYIEPSTQFVGAGHAESLLDISKNRMDKLGDRFS
jgi:hypothetical protein